MVKRGPGDGVFLLLLVAYVAGLAAFYPATYGIDDECEILALARALGQGTPFMEQAGIGIDVGEAWRGHRVSRYSPLHAALLAPALREGWRGAFLVTAAFFLLGAFVVRDLLRREGLSPAWSALYFLHPGLLYYSRTLVSMLPAAVLVLLGASLLWRERPRPFIAGLVLGTAVLLHVWTAPAAALLATGWWIERGAPRPATALALACGVLPAVLLMAAYNQVTMGSPLLNVYWVRHRQDRFSLHDLVRTAPLYLPSLLLAPLGGWAAFVRRWAQGWTIPVTVASVTLLAAAYYQRDGRELGLPGLVQAQRFLLPAAVLACLPAARWLSATAGRAGLDGRRGLGLAVVAVFVLEWASLSGAHQAYLRANADVQATVRRAVPSGALVVGNVRARKAFAPVNGWWNFRTLRPGMTAPPEAYVAWLSPPGFRPPAEALAGRPRLERRFQVWRWRRDLWIAGPRGVYSGPG